MNWETKLISVYLKVCDLWDQGVCVSAQRFSNGRSKALSDQEVMTIYLFGVLQGHSEVKAIFRYFADHFSDWFPGLKTYAAFCYRLNVLQDAFIGASVAIVEEESLGFPESARQLIDSMPIVMAKAKRSSRAKVAPELANKGYCASKGEYYYGVKLHCLAFDIDGRIPFPNIVGLTEASLHDLPAFRQVSDEVVGVDIFADNAYTDSELFQQMRDEQDAILTTPVKRKKKQQCLDAADKAYSTAVAQIRQPIESLFNWIQTKTKVHIASKVRSSAGLKVHVFGKLAAALMAMVLGV